MGLLATSVNLLPDSTFFFQLVVFGLAVGILSWGIFGPITRVLDLRKEKTVGDSAEASELLARADALATQYSDKVRQAKLVAHDLKEALRQEGFAKATEIMNAARHESLEEMGRARKTIQAQVETARKALSDEANTFALAIVKKMGPVETGASTDFVEENNGVHE